MNVKQMLEDIATHADPYGLRARKYLEQIKPVAWQCKSKENGTWGPPFNSIKTARSLAAEGHEVRELYA